MRPEAMIGIVGAVLTVGVTINAFFLKGIMTGLSTMQVELAKVIVKIENYNNRIEALEHNVRKLEINQIECRGKCESTNNSVSP